MTSQLPPGTGRITIDSYDQQTLIIYITQGRVQDIQRDDQHLAKPTKFMTFIWDSLILLSFSDPNILNIFLPPPPLHTHLSMTMPFKKKNTI